MTSKESLVATGLSELQVVTLTLHHEAALEGRIGMMAVGNVLRNRRAWGKWGPTMRDVCLARRQFSCWSPDGGKLNHDALIRNVRSMRDGDDPAILMLAADLANHLSEIRCFDLTDGADHYYAPAAMKPMGARPAWAQGRTPVLRFGGHTFYRLRNEN